MLSMCCHGINVWDENHKLFYFNKMAQSVVSFGFELKEEFQGKDAE